jgi:CDP-4-dehydro-6-deoxyglucose reductase
MPDVTVLPDEIQVTAQAEETLLRALARVGLRYRVGCKRGGCGVCKVQLLLGEVRYERPIATSVLSDDERVEGICLSCRAVPLTNVVIELQEGDRLRRVLGFLPPPPTAPAAAPHRSHDADPQNADPQNADPQKGRGRWVPPARLSASGTSTSG